MNPLKIFFILFTFTFLLKAEAKKIKGTIFNGEDSVDVIFIVPVNIFFNEIKFEKLQYKIKYLSPNGEKIKLTPDEATEIRFNYQEKKIRMISKFNTIGYAMPFTKIKNIFLSLEIDGNLKLFSYYYRQSSYNGSTGMSSSYLTSDFILEKNDEELYYLNSNFTFGNGPNKFKNEMNEYLSDCPSLLQKIDDGDYRRRDIFTIVKFYNSNCRSN